MKVKKVGINEVYPNNYNPNVLDRRKFEILKNNIEEGEMLQPILINSDGEIIDGYHRWKASKEVGLDEILVVEIEDGEEKQRLKTLAFNRLRGKNNPSMLADLLDDLVEKYNIEDIENRTGFNEEYIDSILDLKGVEEVDLDFGEWEQEEQYTRYSSIFDNKSKIPKEYGEVILKGVEEIQDISFDLSVCEILIIYLTKFKEDMGNES